MTTPPLTFGMQWIDAGTQRRRGDRLPLFVAAITTVAFDDAYKHARATMVAAGYSWTDLGSETGKLRACWWDHGVPCDLAALETAVAEAAVAGEAERAERARQDEERAAARRAALLAEVAEVQNLSGPIREELTALLAGRKWAFGRHLADARRLAEDGEWTHGCLQYAVRAVDGAGANVERAETRLNRPAPAVWFARAADPAVRTAALEGCRYISALDEDWASDRNGIGWSQATSWTGHLLSERDELDQGQAGHALHLLYTHRRQLPPALRARIFEGALPVEPAQAVIAL